MAVTEQSYTGNGSTTNYAFTFPYLESTDVEVQVDATVTTAWTFANATTVQFNTAPSNGAKIKILRKTNVDNLTATFYAGSAIKSEDLNDNFTQNLYSTQETSNRAFETTGGTLTGDITLGEDVTLTFEGATDNAHETTITVVDPTADRTITLPNVTGTVVTTGDTGTVATGMIAADAITNAKIANDAIGAEHLTANSVGTSELAPDSVTGDIIPDNAINSEHYADGSIDLAHMSANSVDSDQYVDGSIDRVHLAADIVDGTKIADDSINSEHYVDGSIDTAHIADAQVTTAKIASQTITASNIAAGTILGLNIQDQNISTPKIADLNVTTAKLADQNVTTAKIANDAITGAKIADDAIDSEHYTDGSIDTAHIGNDQVTNDKIATDAVNADSIAANAVGASELADNAVDTAAIADNAVTSAKIAANAVTTTEIADAELTTLAGMQSSTASILAGSTALTATLTEINTVVDGKGVQTTISDSDAHYPTSGAVVDYVTAQIAPIGGLEVIADEDSFPAIPAAGVVISIADVDGIVINSSGVCTTARTSGNGSDNVTINGFPTALRSKTLSGSLGLMVSSTGSSNTYNYHKLLGKEDDIEQLSQDISDFGNRYRVHAGEPSSNNDDGDLVFDTNANKMKVYDATASAWKEVTSSGDFKFLVPVDAGTTTAATWDGSDTSFDLKETTNSGSAASITSVYQLIISLNGVIQKPNAGSWSGSGEGFYLTDSDTIRFATAPPTGSSAFIIQVGSAITPTTPADNTVATAKIQNGAVTTAKVADNAITADKIADNLDIPDGNKIRFGTGNDLEIYHNGSDSIIHDNGTGSLKILGSNVTLQNAAGTQNGFIYTQGGSVALYNNNNLKLETTSTGATVTGKLLFDSSTEQTIKLEDDRHIHFGTGADMKIFHDGSNSYIQEDGTGQIIIRGWAPEIQSGFSPTSGRSTGETAVKAITDGAVELYHNAIKTFETDANGVKVLGPEGGSANLYIYGDEGDDNNDKFVFIANDGEFTLQNYTSGSWEKNIECNGNGNVELYHDNSKKFETTESGIAITGPSKGVCTNNLIINGAMNIDQRNGGSAYTGTTAYTLDRWKLHHGDTNENPTVQQITLDKTNDASPWAAGLRSALKLTNGNQTSTDAGDYLGIIQHIEAQNMKNCGWDYESTSDYITLSFWIKSSVAQNFYGYLRSQDGTAQRWRFETGSLTANTWTKITKTISGDSNIQIDNNEGAGFSIFLHAFWGTAYTSAGGLGLGSWGAYAGGTRTPDYTDTFWTTDNATWELTGFQLEIGKVANDYKFEAYDQELRRCERYYYEDANVDHRLADGQIACNVDNGAYALPVGNVHPTTMRASPTLTLSNFNYSGCAFNSSNANYRNWGMRVTVDNTSQFRITAGEATFDAEL